jgi:hypothetical protein
MASGNHQHEQVVDAAGALNLHPAVKFQAASRIHAATVTHNAACSGDVVRGH